MLKLKYVLVNTGIVDMSSQLFILWPVELMSTTAQTFLVLCISYAFSRIVSQSLFSAQLWRHDTLLVWLFPLGQASWALGLGLQSGI